MPPVTFWRNRETRVSQRERFTSALGTDQNRRDRPQGRANCHKHSQNSPNVAGGLDGANLANGRANLRGAAVFLRHSLQRLPIALQARSGNGWTGITLKPKP